MAEGSRLMRHASILAGLGFIVGAWFVHRLMDKAADSIGARDRAIDDDMEAFGSRQRTDPK
jgi:hypothetical protein